MRSASGYTGTEVAAQGQLFTRSALRRHPRIRPDELRWLLVDQRLLEQVERANLFLMPLDEVRGWWRYHQLFAELLRARLWEERPELAAHLHRNAATWCQDHGLADDAIRHALGAGEVVSAAQLIEKHFDELHEPSEGATVQRWLASVPAGLAASRPRLLLAQGSMSLLGGRLEEAEVLLDATGRASADGADEPFAPSAGRAGSLLVNISAALAIQRAYLAPLRGDGEATASFASQALAEVREGEQMLSAIAQGLSAVAQRFRGLLAEAEQNYATSIAGWRARRPARLSGPAVAVLRAGQRGHRIARGPAHARRRRPGRAAQRTRTGGAAIAGGRQAQPADSPGPGGVTAHRQETRHPCPGQARRGQPHRGDRPRPRTRLALLSEVSPATAG